MAIAVTGMELDDQNLILRYELSNNSDHDVWIFAGMGLGEFGMDAEMFVDTEARTLVVRSRLDTPILGLGGRAYGRYMLMRARESAAETISLGIPLHAEFRPGGKHPSGGVEEAAHLVLEIGYYDGDLPGMIRDAIRKAGSSTTRKVDDRLRRIREWVGGPVWFNRNNEGLRARSEEIVLPHARGGPPLGERVLRIVRDDVHIRCEEESFRPATYVPDLTSCVRVEVRCKPSLLEYFFPYAGQRRLLSREETEYLKSASSLLLNDTKAIEAFASEIHDEFGVSGIVRQRTVAHVTGQRDSGESVTFAIYNNESVVVQGQYQFLYPEGFPSLRKSVPLIQAVALRVQCAGHLLDLWNHLRSYSDYGNEEQAHKSSGALASYPAPAEWCDAIARACEKVGMVDYHTLGLFACPSATGGKFYYAMNANCAYDSPPDTVLLFEAKGGWNEHGGPELFALDNHDPKGGCVLLNNGTVKFIRSEEELKQLRWK